MELEEIRVDLLGLEEIPVDLLKLEEILVDQLDLMDTRADPLELWYIQVYLLLVGIPVDLVELESILAGSWELEGILVPADLMELRKILGVHFEEEESLADQLDLGVTLTGLLELMDLLEGIPADPLDHLVEILADLLELEVTRAGPLDHPEKILSDLLNLNQIQADSWGRLLVTFLTDSFDLAESRDLVTFLAESWALRSYYCRNFLDRVTSHTGTAGAVTFCDVSLHEWNLKIGTFI